MIGKFFGVADRMLDRLFFKKSDQAEQWSRTVAELLKVVKAEEDKKLKTKIERHTSQERDADLIIMCQPMGFSQDAEFFKFEGIKATVVHEVVRDQETNAVLESRWRINSEFIDRNHDPSAEPRTQHVTGFQAFERWRKEDHRFNKRKNIRVIRIRREGQK